MRGRGGPAVLGRPVGHSLSPLLHRAAYAALGLTDWTYDALDVGAEDLPVLLAGLGEEWRGFSVTMPCKQAAVEVADVVEPLPRLLHAANTLVRTEAGAGARRTPTSPASAWRCRAAGSSRSGTRPSSAPAGRRRRPPWRWPRWAPSTSTSSSASRPGRRPAAGAGRARGDGGGHAAGATTLGRRSGGGQHRARRRAVRPSPPCRGGPAQTVLDVLYAPWPTPLAQRVDRGRRPAIGGLEVLFWQATAQVELMTGRPAPIAAMRARWAPRPAGAQRADARRCGHGPAARSVAGGHHRAARPSGTPRPGRRRSGSSHLLLAAAAVAAGPALAGDRPAAGALAWFGAAALVLADVDLRRHRLPDPVTFPALIGCGVALLADAVVTGEPGAVLRTGAAALLAGGAGLAVRVVPGGPGPRDAKLLGLLGVVLGWAGWGVLMGGVFAGLLVGALGSVLLIAVGRAGWRTRVPFGPPLLVGAFIALALTERSPCRTERPRPEARPSLRGKRRTGSF